MLMLAMYSKEVAFKTAILGQNAGVVVWDEKVTVHSLQKCFIRSPVWSKSTCGNVQSQDEPFAKIQKLSRALMGNKTETGSASEQHRH